MRLRRGFVYLNYSRNKSVVLCRLTFLVRSSVKHIKCYDMPYACYDIKLATNIGCVCVSVSMTAVGLTAQTKRRTSF